MCGQSKLSPAQLRQRQAAGKSRYRQLVRTILRENPGQPERAAERLSCIRLNWGFRKTRGLTARYMLAQAWELGLDLESDAWAGRLYTSGGG